MDDKYSIQSGEKYVLFFCFFCFFLQDFLGGGGGGFGEGVRLVIIQFVAINGDR